MGDRGRTVVGEKVPITGETAILAVRNKITRDAKIYRVTFDDVNMGIADQRAGVSMGGVSIVHESAYLSRVMTPDGARLTVEELRGELLLEAQNELIQGFERLKALHAPDAVLSDVERAAAHSIANRVESQS